MGSEAHLSSSDYASMTARDFLYEIFSFVYNGGSGRPGVRFADNDVTHSVYSGTAYALSGSAVSSSSFFATSGGFVTLESKTAMPSGNRWQISIKATSTSVVAYDYAPKGGWVYTSNAFPSTVPKTGNISIFESFPRASSKLLFSSSDMDTYSNANIPVEYFRVLLRATSTVSYYTGLRVGGYIPFDQINDTNPCCVLSGQPSITNATTNWGDLGSTSWSRIQEDVGGNILDISKTWCTTAQIASFTSFVTRANFWVNFPVYVYQFSSNALVGHFGKFDMMHGQTSRTNGAVDSTSSYIVVNSYMMRYKP